MNGLENSTTSWIRINFRTPQNLNELFSRRDRGCFVPSLWPCNAENLFEIARNQHPHAIHTGLWSTVCVRSFLGPIEDSRPFKYCRDDGIGLLLRRSQRIFRGSQGLARVSLDACVLARCTQPPHSGWHIFSSKASILYGLFSDLAGWRRGKHVPRNRFNGMFDDRILRMGRAV